MTETVLAHVSDLHFGVHADLKQLERLPAYLMELRSIGHRRFGRPDAASPPW